MFGEHLHFTRGPKSRFCTKIRSIKEVTIIVAVPVVIFLLVKVKLLRYRHAFAKGESIIVSFDLISTITFTYLLTDILFLL
jgi:hypothetical protein